MTDRIDDPEDVLGRYEPLVDDVEAFREACARPLPAVVRVNEIKATPEEVAAGFDEEGIPYERVDWHAEGCSPQSRALARSGRSLLQLLRPGTRPGHDRLDTLGLGLGIGTGWNPVRDLASRRDHGRVSS
jgi:hypothetical protein